MFKISKICKGLWRGPQARLHGNEDPQQVPAGAGAYRETSPPDPGHQLAQWTYHRGTRRTAG